MGRQECCICGGSRLIRLPARAPVSVRYNADDDLTLPVNSVREYACPECSPKIDDTKVRIFAVEGKVDSQTASDDRYRATVTRQCASALVDEILNAGLISATWGAEDTMRREVKTTCTVGVVSPRTVATMEQRIAERQAEVAAKVADEAVRLIGQWGSYYGAERIDKAQAVDSVREAFKSVTTKQ